MTAFKDSISFIIYFLLSVHIIEQLNRVLDTISDILFQFFQDIGVGQNLGEFMKKSATD